MIVRNLAALSAVLLLVACGDPMATLPRLSEADIPEDPAMLSAMPAPEAEAKAGGGFLARLLGGTPSGPDPERGDGDGAMPSGNTAAPEAATDKQLPPEAYGVTASVPEMPDKKGGLLGLFARNRTDGQAGATEAALTSPAIGPGTVLPYGRIAKVCGMPKKAMGKLVARHPEKRPRHLLYDSAPGNTAPHSFYLTGFADGCPRQFTASVAIFGSVVMHEQLRYGLPAEVQPYSDTDKAYEKVKSRICGVPRKKPCGSRLNRLEDNTVFLSIYENFGGNDRWSNLLLHGGQILAQDIKG